MAKNRPHTFSATKADDVAVVTEYKQFAELTGITFSHLILQALTEAKSSVLDTSIVLGLDLTTGPDKTAYLNNFTGVPKCNK